MKELQPAVAYPGYSLSAQIAPYLISWLLGVRLGTWLVNGARQRLLIGWIMNSCTSYQPERMSELCPTFGAGGSSCTGWPCKTFLEPVQHQHQGRGAGTASQSGARTACLWPMRGEEGPTGAFPGPVPASDVQVAAGVWCSWLLTAWAINCCL